MDGRAFNAIRPSEFRWGTCEEFYSGGSGVHLIRRVHKAAMPILPMPSAAADRADEAARRHPERETLELATAGAAQVLGPDHGVTKALAKAAVTMDRVDLWHARLAVKTLRRDQREAIAEVGEG